jgi:transposase
LAVFGHNRDGQEKLPCIVYGLLADVEGRPVSVHVYPGNTGDPSTVPDQVEKIRGRFGLSHVILVGDRGMLTKTQIETLRQYPGLGWLSALRSEAIRALMDTGCLKLSAFAHQTLAEIVSPDFPGERLFACFNELLAQDRKRTRTELLDETEKDLQGIVREAARRTKKPLTDVEIGVKVGRAINRHKVGKHFAYTIENHGLRFERKTDAIKREAELDGIYVIRTSEPAERIGAADAVRGYKNLAQVERAFRCIKGIDARVRPIFHHTPDHVRAHIFLCMLAYYVDWHIRQAWAPLLFADESLPQTRLTRDPVAPAGISPQAKAKKKTRLTEDGFEVQSFDSLMAILGTRCQNTCRMKMQGDQMFTQNTQPTPLQKRALELLGIKT